MEMRKWWRWLPGWRKNWKLEKRRIEALSEITRERLDVEAMAQRPQSVNDIIDTVLLEKVLKRIREIEANAKQAVHIDDLDDLIDDAEQQGQFKGYLCPVTEIQDEGEMVFDRIEEWGVPKTKIKKLRDVLGKKLEKTDTNPEAGSSALYDVFRERDSWADYTDRYEDKMQSYMRWLIAATIALLPLAILAFHLAVWFQPLLLFGLLCAGVVGVASAS
jgi:hypothetical protein